MSMKDTLKKAKIAAMKAKDKAKLNPINLTLADIQNLEIANGHEATDEEVLKVIQKGVKTRRETAKLYEDKGLADKAAPETAEADFLETFLPAAASDEDYAKAVADAVAEVNPAGPRTWVASSKPLVPRLPAKPSMAASWPVWSRPSSTSNRLRAASLSAYEKRVQTINVWTRFS